MQGISKSQIGQGVVMAVALMTIAACGGSRQAQPIAIARPGDKTMTCDEINAELANNEFQIVALNNEMNEASQRRARNTFLGGMIGYATSEDGGAAQQESSAYATRNVQLRAMARERKCTY